MSSPGSMAALLVFVVLDQIPQRAAGNVRKVFVEHLEAGDALGVEVAEILAQLAVPGDRPALPPERHRQRPDRPRCRRAALVDIPKPDLPLLANGGTQPA